MSSEWWKRIRIVLVIALVVAAVRVGIIFYERHQPIEARKPPERESSYTMTDDDYVAPPKVFPYDLKSANKELSGKTVWVRSGNRLAYYPYSGAAHRLNLSHNAGVLAPLEKLKIKDFLLQNNPRSPKQKQIMAIFVKAGDPIGYGAPAGIAEEGTYTFYVNEIFFLEDPHQLYKHWPAEIWNAIDHHEAKPGMNELQVGFALGTSAIVGTGDYGNRQLEYTNAGKTVTVTFSNNRAVKVEQGTGQ
jgi:hypothetical protein